MKKRRKFSKRLRKNFNLITGIMIFILLIGSAFSVSWIFGMGFFLGFVFSVYNRTLDKKPFLPLMLFLGGLIIRTALIWALPSMLEAKNYLDFFLALIIFLVIFLIGNKVRKGRF